MSIGKWLPTLPWGFLPLSSVSTAMPCLYPATAFNSRLQLFTTEVKIHSNEGAYRGLKDAVPSILYLGIRTHLSDLSVSIFTHEYRKRIAMIMWPMTPATPLPIGRCCNWARIGFAESWCTSQTATENIEEKYRMNLVGKLTSKLFCNLLFTYKSSSSCSWRVRRVSSSLILKMKLVPPSLPRSSYVPSSFWSIL